MKKILIIILSLFILLVSCKKKEKFVEPEIIIAKWIKAIETLNYRDYRKCEAYPREEEVFKEMYREYYLVDAMVTEIEELDEKNVKKDVDDNSYIQRNVYFECSEVTRKTGKPVHLIRGDVVFLKFIDGIRKNDGWLMSNRTLVRIKRGKE